MLLAVLAAATAIRGAGALASAYSESQKAKRVDWELAIGQAEAVVASPDRYSAEEVEAARLVLEKVAEEREAGRLKELERQRKRDLALEREVAQRRRQEESAARERAEHEKAALADEVRKLAWARATLADPAAHPLDLMTARLILEEYRQS